MLVRITEPAAKMIGTTADLKAGTWMTLRDLLYGCMLPSGNDAAYMLA
jgi:serine-type D-Ala-D-Ala carboxypeptidase (penicillin-binding protein 5/6)